MKTDKKCHRKCPFPFLLISTQYLGSLVEQDTPRSIVYKYLQPSLLPEFPCYTVQCLLPRHLNSLGSAILGLTLYCQQALWTWQTWAKVITFDFKVFKGYQESQPSNAHLQDTDTDTDKDIASTSIQETQQQKFVSKVDNSNLQ